MRGGGGSEAGRRHDQPARPLAVPGLAGQDRALDTDALSHDAPVAGLARTSSSGGSWAGHEREFKGASKTFTDVDLADARLPRPAGARAYVAFVATHAASYYGPGTVVSR